MAVLDDEQCLERKTKDHNTVKDALWSTNESPSAQHNETNGTWSYSKKSFLLREKNVLQLNQMLTAEKFCKTKKKASFSNWFLWT